MVVVVVVVVVVVAVVAEVPCRQPTTGVRPPQPFRSIRRGVLKLR